MILNNIEEQITQTVKRNGQTVKMSYSDIVLDNNKGKEYLNATYPDEFEYYACALELTDETGKVLEFFSFPIMPQSISETKFAPTNIKKTLGGVVITNHTTFNPFDISLNGHFGRKFRKVLYEKEEKKKGNSETGESGADLPYEGITYQQANQGVILPTPPKKIFSSEYKTGYGCIKILENIFSRAHRGVDKNRKPLRLYFYNLSLSSNYLVEPVNLQLSQSRDQNMLWQYNLQLKAVAPARLVNSNYRNSMIKIRDYNQKYVRMTRQSSLINEMLKDVINGQTPVQSLLNQFKNYKAYAQQSGFKLLKQLTDNPLEDVNFIKNRR
jgi:hypothetical protein